jgi:hypothetical protein
MNVAPSIEYLVLVTVQNRASLIKKGPQPPCVPSSTLGCLHFPHLPPPPSTTSGSWLHPHRPHRLPPTLNSLTPQTVASRLRRCLCRPAALPGRFCHLKAEVPKNSKTLICDTLTVPPLPGRRAASILIRSTPLSEEDNRVRLPAQLNNTLGHEHKESCTHEVAGPTPQHIGPWAQRVMHSRSSAQKYFPKQKRTSRWWVLGIRSP